MNRSRTLWMLIFALVLALGVSACQKAEQSELSSTDENPATVSETPAEQTPPATEPTPPAEEPAKAPKNVIKSSTKSSSAVAASAKSNSVSLPSGTQFDIALTTEGVGTKTSNVGDHLEGTLVAPLTVDGHVIAETGAVVRGEITELTRASRSKSEEDRASMKFAFTSIQTVDGEKTLNSTVTNTEGKMEAKSTGTRDKLIIGGSTVLGGVIGKVAGKSTKSTILGAVGGAVLGTGVVLAAKGYELEVPAGSKISLRADAPITVVSK